MTDVRSKAVNSKPAAASGGGKVKAFFKYIGKNKMFCIGMLIVIIAVLSAVLAPVIAPCDPQQMTPSIRLTKPFTDSEHILGCDAMGRDIFSRILYGLRTSLLISIGGVALALAIGVVLGIISGFSHPNFIDTLIMRITDIQMGFPFIVLAIIALTLFEPNPLSIIIVLSLSAWPAYARVVRSSVMMQKDMDYIAAARMMGAGKLRIAVKYVGKNLMPAILPVLPLDIQREPAELYAARNQVALHISRKHYGGRQTVHLYRLVDNRYPRYRNYDNGTGAELCRRQSPDKA